MRNRTMPMQSGKAEPTILPLARDTPVLPVFLLEERPKKGSWVAYRVPTYPQEARPRAGLLLLEPDVLHIVHTRDS
jgi:hypothetical protein